MGNTDDRYVLAFDSSCGRCRDISRAVAGASEGGLEVLPLAHVDVQGWLTRYFGSAAPWEPTLVHVRGTDVRCWSGRSMVIPLVRRLGGRATVRVLGAIGRLDRTTPDERERPAGRSMGRKQFLRLGAGAATVLGVMAVGRTPAFARTEYAAARAWVEANKYAIPRAYDEFVTYPMWHRRMIFAELPPAARRDLWLEHLRCYRDAHPEMTSRQREVVDQATTQFADEGVFRDGFAAGAEEQLRSAAIREFGHEDAHALIATLGPRDDAATRAAALEYCDCSKADSWCNEYDVCLSRGCVEVPFTCGTAWVYTCDGNCFRAAP